MLVMRFVAVMMNKFNFREVEGWRKGYRAAKDWVRRIALKMNL
jgi:hypothetical protein